MHTVTITITITITLVIISIIVIVLIMMRRGVTRCRHAVRATKRGNAGGRCDETQCDTRLWFAAMMGCAMRWHDNMLTTPADPDPREPAFCPRPRPGWPG